MSHLTEISTGWSAKTLSSMRRGSRCTARIQVPLITHALERAHLPVCKKSSKWQCEWKRQVQFEACSDRYQHLNYLRLTAVWCSYKCKPLRTCRAIVFSGRAWDADRRRWATWREKHLDALWLLSPFLFSSMCWSTQARPRTKFCCMVLFLKKKQWVRQNWTVLLGA